MDNASNNETFIARFQELMEERGYHFFDKALRRIR
jgi:hypothetical protein